MMPGPISRRARRTTRPPLPRLKTVLEAPNPSSPPQLHLPAFTVSEPEGTEPVQALDNADTDTDGKGKQKDGDTSHPIGPSTDSWEIFWYNASQAFLPSASLEKDERGWILNKEYIRAEESNWLKKGYGHAEGKAKRAKAFWDMPFLVWC